MPHLLRRDALRNPSPWQAIGRVIVASSLLLFAPPGLSAQTSDVTPPQLTGFSFSPTTIDTTAGAGTLTVSATITDDLSGLAYCDVYFSSPSFHQSQIVPIFGPPVTGNPLNGSYQGTIPFPQFTESGAWSVNFVVCFDTVFNQLFLSTTGLQSLGFPTQLDVVSTPDTSPTEITGFSLSPASIDVSSSAQTVTITLDLTDNLSGVDFGVARYSAASLIMQSPSGQQTQVIGNDKFTQIGGTPLSGRWQTQLTLPQSSEAGTWTLQRLFLDDAVGNFVFLYAADFQARGLSSNLSVTSAPDDVSPPQLTTLSISPALIDTAAGPQTVVITIEATDNLAGVSFSPSWPFTTCGLDPSNSQKRVGLLLVSPAAGQTRCLEPDFGFGSSAITLISGSPQNGVWQGSIFFPQFSEEGTWKASLILKDAVENFKSYATTDLQLLLAPTDLVVVKPSLVPDGTLLPAGGTVADDVFGSRAQITAPAGVLTVPTTVAIDVFASPLALPTPTGYSGPGTYFVNVHLTPTPAFPLPAPGLTLVLPLVSAMTPGARIDLYRVDPATGILVPSLDATGLPILGTVNAGGLSATFTGVVHLSVVVGLIPVVTTATPLVTVTGGPFTYDGHAHPATAKATGIGGVVVPGSFTFSYVPGGSSAPVNAGTYAVTATFTSGNPGYTNASGTGAITIQRAQPTIAWATPAAINEGTALGGAQLNATVDAPGTLIYTPAAGTLLDDGTHTLTVSFTPSDPSNYRMATKTVTILVSPTAGRLEGEGSIETSSDRYEFEFFVLERAKGAERGQLTLEVEPVVKNARGAKRVDTFVTTRIDQIVFSDDPRFLPGRARRPLIDTATFSGVGRFNGMAGYTFTAQASDAGEPGRGRDLFAVTIRDPRGVTVVTISGPITRGNIQSSRMR